MFKHIPIDKLQSSTGSYTPGGDKPLGGFNRFAHSAGPVAAGSLVTPPGLVGRGEWVVGGGVVGVEGKNRDKSQRFAGTCQ